jgi:hypothetical protein
VNVKHLCQDARCNDKNLPFMIHNATTVLTIAKSCEMTGGFKQRAHKSSLMMVCVAPKHVGGPE